MDTLSTFSFVFSSLDRMLWILYSAVGVENPLSRHDQPS